MTPSGKLDRNALPELAAEALTARKAALLGPRDNCEAHIKQIWVRVLGTEQIGIRDDFFRIGGNSLKAALLSTQMSQAFGRDISVRLIFDKPSIEGQAAFLREGTGLSIAASLVPIRRVGTESPLFCVHPFFGLAHCYIEFANLLGPNQPVYGLQSHGLEEGQQPLSTIQEMAAFYLQSIRSVQPSGPYRLAGWSMGGVIAFEMAQQLLAVGETVSFVGLLETRSRVHGLAAFLPRNQSRSILQAEQEYLVYLAGHDLGISKEEMLALDHEKRIELYLERAKAADKIPFNLSQEQFRRLVRVSAINQLATLSYRAKKYPGRVTLLRIPSDQKENDCYGWDTLASGGIEMFLVPGTHDEFLAAPSVVRVAEIIRGCLQSGESESDRVLFSPAGS